MLFQKFLAIFFLFFLFTAFFTNTVLINTLIIVLTNKLFKARSSKGVCCLRRFLLRRTMHFGLAYIIRDVLTPIKRIFTVVCLLLFVWLIYFYYYLLASDGIRDGINHI